MVRFQDSRALFFPGFVFRVCFVLFCFDLGFFPAFVSGFFFLLRFFSVFLGFFFFGLYFTEYCFFFGF